MNPICRKLTVLSIIFIFIVLYAYQYALDKLNQTIVEPAVYNDLLLWSTDFHISPIYDLKSILKEFEVSIIDESLSGHCGLTETCAKDLQILNQHNGLALGHCPNKLKESFFNYYVNDNVFSAVDAVICTHATSLCEIYMAFGKPLILIASTRYDIGRFNRKNPLPLREWNKNLQRIARNPMNVIAANNRYDQEYIKYFTGITPYLLPSAAHYIPRDVVYCPIFTSFLLGPSRSVNHDIAEQLFAFAKAMTRGSVEVHAIRSLYPKYTLSQLAMHAGMIVIPYQISIMSFFEYYRMGIPLFVPSVELLLSWHFEFNLLDELTWDLVYEKVRYNSSYIIKNSTSSMQYDPNDQVHMEAVREWLLLSDFYQYPYINYFSSLEQLVAQLQALVCYEERFASPRKDCIYIHDIVDKNLGCQAALFRSAYPRLQVHSRLGEWGKLMEISRKMINHMDQLDSSNRAMWSSILQKVRLAKELRSSKPISTDFNTALYEAYGVKTSPNNCYKSV